MAAGPPFSVRRGRPETRRRRCGRGFAVLWHSDGRRLITAGFLLREVVIKRRPAPSKGPAAATTNSAGRTEMKCRLTNGKHVLKRM